MNIEYFGKHFDLTDGIKQFTESKLEKVIRFVDEPVEIRVTLDAEKNRFAADIHLSHRFGVLQANEESLQTINEAIQAAAEKLEKQARRSRKKFIDRRRRADRVVQEDGRWPVEVLAKDSFGTGVAPRVIESTHLPIKPMTLDEAAIALETSKSELWVFRDAGTDEVSVLYKRKDENYGLIVPGR
ncbi:MAG: ribosome-associated translation inhibitor RaiA [Acidobacteria bacterium]|nr:ribosome-associated translation inhibitor RaiA [Acidobacteriota bacterium]